MKIKSKAQQGFFAAIAAGKGKKDGPSPTKAMLMLRENKGKMKNLPQRTAPPPKKED